MTDIRSYYQLLCIPEDSSRNEIKSAFRRLTKLEHPDKHDNSPEANAYFRLLFHAYSVLTDPVRKTEYDAYLHTSTVFRKMRKPRFSANTMLSGDTGSISKSPESILSHLNFVLWDIEDFLIDKRETDLSETCGGHTFRHYLLLILTFFDKWVLEPAGYPDYFMEARHLKKIDPRDYVSILGRGRRTGTHIPYTGVIDYFYDIRKRMDRLLENLKTQDLLDTIPDIELSLMDCAAEAWNLAVYYLQYLLRSEHDTKEDILPFSYTNPCFMDRDTW